MMFSGNVTWGVTRENNLLNDYKTKNGFLDSFQTGFYWCPAFCRCKPEWYWISAFQHNSGVGERLLLCSGFIFHWEGDALHSLLYIWPLRPALLWQRFPSHDPAASVVSIRKMTLRIEEDTTCCRRINPVDGSERGLSTYQKPFSLA